MSLPTSFQVTCPKCGNQISVRGWNSINTDMPDAAKKIMSRELFALSCPKCGLHDYVEYDMLYNDMKHDIMIQMLHYSDRENLSEDFIKAYKDMRKLSGAEFRLVPDTIRLAEKVTALEHDRDDRIIELCKCVAWVSISHQNPNMELYKAIYAYSEEKKLDFISYYGKQKEHLIAPFDDNLEHIYRSLKDLMLPVIEEECKDTLIFDYEWAEEFLQTHMSLFGGQDKDEEPGDDYYQHLEQAWNTLSDEQKDRFFPGGIDQADRVIAGLMTMIDTDYETALQIYITIAVRVMMFNHPNERIGISLKVHFQDLILEEVKDQVINYCRDLFNNYTYLYGLEGEEKQSTIDAMDEMYQSSYEANRPLLHDAVSRKGYGTTPDNPIFTHLPMGSYGYLNSLWTVEGDPLTWKRMGSVQGSGNDLVDEYGMYLPSGEQYGTLYVNMYSSEDSQYCPEGYWGAGLQQVKDSNT